MSKICTIKTKEIVDGRNLMNFNQNLKTWESDLDLLEDGEGMFCGCYHLTAFSAKTPKLSNGKDMFTSVGAEGWTEPTLRTFQMDFDSLTYGYRMFAGCGNIELVSNKTLNGCFDFPSLTEAFAMFRGVSKITVREGGSNLSASFGYMQFSSLTDANHMFQGYEDSDATIQVNMFPKVTNFEGCFNYSCFDGADFAFLLGVGPNPNVILNCSYMFSYAEIGSYINIDISNNVTDLSNVFINANDMFSELKTPRGGVIRYSDRFMSRLRYADNMFPQCNVDNTESWKGCRYLESANEMFRGAKFTYTTLADVAFYNLTSANSMFAGSNIKQITNFYTVNAGSYMFHGCTSLTDVDISIATLEDGQYMFSNCSHLVNASIKYNPMQIGQCDLTRMFSGCNKLQSLSIKSWDDTYAEYEGFPDCVKAPYMFSGCYNLSSDDIVSTVWKMTILEDASYMFAQSSLATYPFTMNERLNQLKKAGGMFSNCENLNIDFGLISDKFPNLERGEFMFSYARNASGSWYTSLPNLTNARGMFQLSAIQYLGGENGEVLDFSNASSAYFMFADCVGLTDCYMDLGSCKQFYGMFMGCENLQTVKLHNLSTLENSGGQCQNFFNETKLKHASLHNLGLIYGNCDLMFNTRSPLTIELTRDDSSYSSRLIDRCSSAYRMFANAAWQPFSDISTFLPLQISGLFTGGDCCYELTNISHMFSGRIIQDQTTASNIAGIANYARIATTAPSERGFLGHIFVEDKDNLSWFNTWGNWTIKESETEIFSEYMYQTLARTCLGGGQVSMTVFYPKPNPYDIVEGSQYIPDASTWNDAFRSSGIVATSVHDGYAWDDNFS